MPRPIVKVHAPGDRLVFEGKAREFVVHGDERPARVEISGDLPAQRIAEIASEATYRLTRGAAEGSCGVIQITAVPVHGNLLEDDAFNWPLMLPGSSAV